MMNLIVCLINIYQDTSNVTCLCVDHNLETLNFLKVERIYNLEL